MMQFPVEVLATGVSWTGSGIRSIESGLDNLLMAAKDEVIMSVYAIGRADRVMAKIHEALARGVNITMIINRYEVQPPHVRKILDELVEEFPSFSLFNFSPGRLYDLHAKVIVVDRSIALVGSSNLSRNGFIGNHELALIVRGSIAQQIAQVVLQLTASTDCIRVRP